MRQYRYVDFDCPVCESSHTRFVCFDTDVGLPVEQETCDENSRQYDGVTCDGVLVPREMAGVGYMQPINKNNSDFNERERTRLEKRQDEHWKRQGRDEAVDRERALMKKHGAVGGVK
jgi:hypothetical protein